MELLAGRRVPLYPQPLRPGHGTHNQYGPALREVIRLLLAVHCQSATGAGRRQLDPVTSTFLQHLPGLSHPRVTGPVRTEVSAGQRFTLTRTPATMCNTDPGAPAWPTHRARGAKAQRQLDQVGLGLDWPPSVSTLSWDGHGPAAARSEPRFDSPPQGPDSDWAHPRRLQCHPGADPNLATPPSVQVRPAWAMSPPGQDPPRAATKRFVCKGKYVLTAPPPSP